MWRGGGTLLTLLARTHILNAHDTCGLSDAQPARRLHGHHDLFPFDVMWPENKWDLFARILPFTPVELDQIILDTLTLVATPPYPWGHLVYHKILSEALQAGVPGDFAEFGLGLGGTSIFFARVASEHHRQFLAVDSFKGLPSIDRIKDNPYFVEGDFGEAPGADNHETFLQLLSEFGLQDTVTCLKGLFRDVNIPAAFKQFAFVHIDGDLYSSVYDVLDKVWDRVPEGGIVAIDDFFHKSQGPARAAADFFRAKNFAHPPLLYVVPAYAVLIIKGRSACTTNMKRAIDGNYYSLDMPRQFTPFLQAVNLSVIRAREAVQLEANDGLEGDHLDPYLRVHANAQMFMQLLYYPSTAATSGTDILKYLLPLEDMIDLTDGGHLCSHDRDYERPQRAARKLRIPRTKQKEHRFTRCSPISEPQCSSEDCNQLDTQCQAS
eukprot:TRINITY_DN7971_c0_g1_i1.p1 TRINITY_DN7971_c0_g1~~TRINITY_DN7971_c0_g1_i1.p1  ORF type:complete len:436 (-),score=68.23 TRINITY_DN7971_c0_g1_i1:229-1536(-)